MTVKNQKQLKILTREQTRLGLGGLLKGLGFQQKFPESVSKEIPGNALVWTRSGEKLDFTVYTVPEPENGSLINDALFLKEIFQAESVKKLTAEGTHTRTLSGPGGQVFVLVEPHNNETSARRRKHLTSLLKREGFVRDKVIPHPTGDSGKEKKARGLAGHTEIWSKASSRWKETLTINTFDKAHRDIVRNLIRGIQSPELHGTGDTLYTERNTLHYKLAHNFKTAPEPEIK